MKLLRTLLTAIATLIGASSVFAQAVSGQGTWESTLLGRDINLQAVSATDVSAVYLYDTALNVTWLRDTNANVIGKVTADANANANGTMTWATATNWAANLVTGSGATAISDWRLPTMADPAAIPNCTNGGTNCGWNAATSSSEMASLFFSTLGNKSYLDTSGNPQISHGLANGGSFLNMQGSEYWLGTQYALSTGSAWTFNTTDGYQNTYYKWLDSPAMAVRTGDVAPVPEPEIYAMLLVGLGLIGAVARHRNSGSASRSTPCES